MREVHSMKGVLLAPACLLLGFSRVEALVPGARLFITIGRMAELRSGLRQRVPQSPLENNNDERRGIGKFRVLQGLVVRTADQVVVVVVDTAVHTLVNLQFGSDVLAVVCNGVMVLKARITCFADYVPQSRDARCASSNAQRKRTSRSFGWSVVCTGKP